MKAIVTSSPKANLIFTLAVLIVIGLLTLAAMSIARADTWQKKANMPAAIWSPTATVVDGNIYIIGEDIVIAMSKILLR